MEAIKPESDVTHAHELMLIVDVDAFFLEMDMKDKRIRELTQHVVCSCSFHWNKQLYYNAVIS